MSKCDRLCDRQELHEHLIRMKHETPEWKKAAAWRVAEMKKGRVVTAAELQARSSARRGWTGRSPGALR